ncbi:hypothetical protein PYJP_13850 [Pyrofollis japonicus]|nr:hypothetical protein PYJP_13850 [Pyrofollis japonicus]
MFVAHLSFLEPLGVGHVYAVLNDREKWRYYRDRYAGRQKLLIREMRDIPLVRYVHRFYIFGDGTIGALYYAPKEVRDEIVARLDSFYDEVYDARVYPVLNCLGKLYPEASEGDAWRLGKAMLEKLNTAPPYRSRNRFLDYLLISVMELEPLLTLRELRSLVYAARARIEKELGEELELSMRYVKRHYVELSRRYVLGRLFVGRPNVCSYPVLVVEKKYRELLYGLAAVTMGSTMLADTGDTVIASVGATSFAEQSEFIDIFLPGLEKITTTVSVTAVPFPFEMYNPIEESWSLEEPAVERIEEIVKKY